MTPETAAASSHHRLVSSIPPGGAALAVVEITANDRKACETLLAHWTGARPPAIGAVALRSLGNADRGVIARLDERTALAFPHGGAAVVRAVLASLADAGSTPNENEHPFNSGIDTGGEPPSRFDALLDATLATCESELGLDLLLDQRRVWREHAGFDPASDDARHRARVLAPLLSPPVVAAVGPANVGKSTLTNALARRSIAIVSDTPGTTRDHVGVTLSLAGLCARWLDTPGVRTGSDAAEEAASRTLRPVLAGALVVVSCGDAASGFLSAAQLSAMGVTDGARVVRCLTRCDLDRPSPAGNTEKHDVACSATTGEGLEHLARALRDAAVPAWAIDDASPWAFDPRLRRGDQPGQS
jgi:small GTP-binding protein